MRHLGFRLSCADFGSGEDPVTLNVRGRWGIINSQSPIRQEIRLIFISPVGWLATTVVAKSRWVTTTRNCGRFKKARNRSGEMAEWLKAHAWKACIPQGIQGSNPCLSANNMF